MEGIQATFRLKDNKIEKPEHYLGAQLEQKIIGDVECWTMSSEEYVKAAIVNVETALDATGQRLLPSRCTTPMQANYRPELDDTSELKVDGVRNFQELIGVLRWAVELGHIDIAMEVSMLSTHLALPREGHSQQVHVHTREHYAYVNRDSFRSKFSVEGYLWHPFVTKLCKQQTLFGKCPV
ncbi:Reverse transcriptase (RNA-dependent DNA polymerase) [Fragilaria crotonensis]|nr:Reverse transcriptase (RNA-dependent DNA polymerase) [Fragilaria crotonensis]